NSFAYFTGKTEQVVSERVGLVRRRSTTQSTDVACKAKGTAWILESPALGLKVVHLVVGVLTTKSETVRTTDPAHIDITDILVVAKLEWISRVHVSDAVPPALRKVKARGSFS